MSCAVIGDYPVSYRDQVASERNLTLRERYTHTRSLKRTSPRVVLLRSISKNRHVRDIASGRHPVGNRSCKTASAMLCDVIHVRDVRVLERCLSAEFWERNVSHPVAEENQVLHAAHSTVLLFTPSHRSSLRACRTRPRASPRCTP
uniref:Uncharacterized protein n=1 Tax=Candidatus Methanogaster sp. ANME-2c ERB4 TaxID=2759911 RepID=A0A7G9Y9T2_9EURY|nr:hypothetical protein GJEHNGGF_00003 [Methanosarcinales archaeon ANME-2c ERB4]QNO45146.1 hypothetical protein NBMHDOOP_00013 [Methanosarcinales archaeon ANME-2c ERB4]